MARRGHHLSRHNLVEAERAEAEISNLVKKNMDKYVEPVAAFVTFSSQEGYERCIKHMSCETDFLGYPVFNPSEPGFKLLDQEQVIKEAHEPSNIIWENLEIPQSVRNRRKIGAFLMVCIILFIILAGVGYVKVLSA